MSKPRATRPAFASAACVPLRRVLAAVLAAVTLAAASYAAPAPLQSPAALRKAVAAARPGDTLVLADGVYADAGAFKVTAGGAEGRPVTIRAATPGGVTFTGAAQFRIEANHVVLAGFRFTDGGPSSNSGVIAVKASDVRITECSIIDYNRTSEPEKSMFWIALNGRRNRVDHCLFKGKTTVGVLLFVQRPTDAPDHAQIYRNVFRDIPRGSGNGFETIRIGTSHQSQSDSHSLVAENYFENCDGEIETISVKSGKNTVRDNTFVNCRGTITLRHGAGGTVTGNIFFVTDPKKTDCGGLRINDRDHVIENNYIAGVRTANKHLGGIVLMSSEGDGELPVHAHWRVQNNLIRRNTVLNCQQSFVYGGGEYGTPPLSSTFEQNLVAVSPDAAAGCAPFIRQIHPIAAPAYRGEIYHGAPLGLEPAPAGIDTDVDPKLAARTINGHTLYFATAVEAGARAEALKPLQESDVGPGVKESKSP